MPKAEPNRESIRAAAAYRVYESLGPNRSLARVHEELAQSPDWEGASPSMRQVEEWSSRHKWVTRAKAYDAERIAEKRRLHEARIEETNEQQVRIADALVDLAIQHIIELRDAGKLGSNATVQLLRDMTGLKRLALGSDKPEFSQQQQNGIQIIIETDSTPVKLPELPPANVVDADEDDE